MAGRRSIPTEFLFLGNTTSLEAAYERAAAGAQETSQKMVYSARDAAAAAAQQAKSMGASSDVIAEAAARAAAGYGDAAKKVSASAVAAANAMADMARRAGASADEVDAAWNKQIAASMRYEKAQVDAAKASEESSARQVAAAKKASDAAEAAAAKQSKAAVKLASTVGKWTLGAGAVGGYFAVKGATDLQSQMERLHTQAGVQQARVTQLTQGVLNMSPDVATGPNELAQAMYHVTSSLDKTLPAVSRNATELRVLRTAAEGAKVGGADLVDVTNALDAAVVSGIRGTKNYSQAMGALNSIVGAGDMTMQNLADALGTGILGPMKTYGLSIKDIGGALAVFGDNNIRGQEAATKLTSAVRIMAAPSKEAAKALQVVGISSTQLADDMRRGGIVRALDDLKTHLKESGLTASQQALVITRAFGGRQSTGVQLLVGQLDRLRAKTQQVGEGAHTFNNDWVATTHTFQFQLDQLGASAQTLGDKFGMVLIPELEGVIHTSEDVVGWLGKHRAAADALAVTVGGVLSAAVATYAYTKAKAFITATTGMVTGTVNLGAKLLGMDPVFAASESETTQLTAAIDGLSAQIAALGGEAEAAAGGITSIGGAAAAATPEVEGLDAAMGSGGLLGTVGALAAKMGPLAVAFGAFEALKQTPGIGNVFGNGKGTANQFPLPKRGETERAWLSENAGLPGYGGPLTAAGIEKARVAQGYPAEKSLVGELFKQMASQGHFGRHGFVPVPVGSGTLSGGVGGAFINPSATTTTPNQFIAWMMQHGLSKNAAAGIAGNIGGAEDTGWYGGQWQNGSPVGAPTSGYGLVQWSTGAYHQGLADMAKKMGQSTASIAVQEAYLKSTMGRGLIGQLNSAQTPAGAAAIFEQQYERAGIINMAGRTGAATKYAGASPSTLAAYNALVGSGTGTSSGKATMRYYNHQPVGVMTEPQWQAWQSQNGTAKTRSGASGAISTMIGGDVTRYQDLAMSASTETVKRLYLATAANIKTLGVKFEREAKSVSTSTQEAKIKDALRVALTAITDGVTARVRVLAHAAADAKAGNSLITRFQGVAQNGTTRTLENALGVRTGGRVLAMIHQEIEGVGGRASSGAITRALAPVLGHAATGQANARYQQEVAGLRATGQDKLADRLIAAHKAAMQALALTMYAEQVTKDGKELEQQSTALKDQTTAIQNAMQDAQTVFQAQEQKSNDASQAIVQGMQDQQRVLDDMAASVVQHMADIAQIHSDQSQSVVDAINDQTQTQVDQIGEKGLYGLHLIAQQDRVIADQTKAKWDQILDTDKQNLDIAKANAGVAESAAQLNLDQVTAQEHAAVAIAQGNRDTVTLAQDMRISSARAHADAVQLHVDSTLIGPAQIAVDMNANASKAVQDKMAAQLAKATGQGDRQVALADKQLALTQSDAQTQINLAQQQYDATNNQATQLIQGAQNNLQSVTDSWNQIIQGLQNQLTGDQGAAARAEASANSAASVAGAQASTQFAGSGLNVNIYGADLSNPSATRQEVGWAIRQANIQTV